MSKQLSIDFDPDVSKAYGSLVEYCQHLSHTLGVQQKVIAADMDLSPSHLSRKLAQNPNDSLRFTCDDLELFMATRGTVEPIRYLISKYMAQASTKDLEKEIQRLQDELEQRKLKAV